MEEYIRLLEKRQEAQDIETFIFEKPQGLEYKAGQYAHFDLSQLTHPDPRGASHHFTLSSSPTENYLSFTTKIRAESGYKQTFLELQVGDKVKIRKIKGMFTLEDETTTIPQIFIAGGIGITPYRSIIRYMTDKNLPIPTTLIYSASTVQEMAFKDELDSITKNYPNITVNYTITKPQKSLAPWNGYVGRVDETMINTFVDNVSVPIFWLCGPPNMVEAMEGVLADLSVPSEHVKTERFTGY